MKQLSAAVQPKQAPQERRGTLWCYKQAGCEFPGLFCQSRAQGGMRIPHCSLFTEIIAFEVRRQPLPAYAHTLCEHCNTTNAEATKQTAKSLSWALSYFLLLWCLPGLFSVSVYALFLESLFGTELPPSLFLCSQTESSCLWVTSLSDLIQSQHKVSFNLMLASRNPIHLDLGSESTKCALREAEVVS